MIVNIAYRRNLFSVLYCFNVNFKELNVETGNSNSDFKLIENHIYWANARLLAHKTTERST